MLQKRYLFTPEGLARLQAELDHLRTVRRQAAAERIQLARETGGHADNAQYEDAKNEQALLEGRIRTLESMINQAIVSTPDRDNPRIEFGDRVTVRNQDGTEEVFTIVGSAEANPSEGRISYESPVGQALLGKKVGDEVEITVPAGVLKLIITKMG